MAAVSIVGLRSVSRLRLASVLASAFDDHHPKALVAWRGTIRDDLSAGRCSLQGSCLAVQRKQPIGAALVYDGYGDSHWRLGALGIVPTRQRGGVGSALVQHILAAASRTSVECVTCEVEVGNVAAKRFFEQANFQSEGQLLDFQCRGGLPLQSDLIVRTSTWDQVSQYFGGQRGLRTRSIVASYAEQPGTSILHIDGRGAAVMRGRWLVDLAVAENDLSTFQTLVSATFGQASKIIWRHVPQSSNLARLAKAAGLDPVRTSISMVHV